MAAAEFARVRKILKISLFSLKYFFVGLHLEFLTTKCGLLKIFELLLGELELKCCLMLIE